MTQYLPYRHNFLKTIGDVRRLLVIVAMKSEEDALLGGLEFTEAVIGKRSKVDLKEFQLPRCQVMVARSGVGLVNGAILMTQIAEHRSIDAVVLLGVGGALDKKLQVGDVIISNQVIQHDSLLSGDGERRLIAPGELTLSAAPDKQVDPVMRCDSVLVAWAANSLGGDRVFIGTLLSGSEFAANAARKAQLRALAPDALVVDMEAAAIAQIARRMEVPFVAIKTVADRAEPGSSISDDYSRFLKAATEHGSAVLRGLLESFG